MLVLVHERGDISCNIDHAGTQSSGELRGCLFEFPSFNSSLAMAGNVLIAILAALLAAVVAQSPNSTMLSTTTSLVHSTLVTTVPVLLPTGSATHTTTSILTTTVVTDVPVIVVGTPATTNAANATNAPSANATQAVTLDTHVDPAFGVLGAILIITGIPNAFWGHKNRWCARASSLCGSPPAHRRATGRPSSSSASTL